MNGQLIDGRAIANRIFTGLKQEISELKFIPIFYDIVVGNDPVSLSYVKIKGRKATDVGIKFEILQLSDDIETQDLITQIRHIQNQSHVCGVIIQLPLPSHIDKAQVLASVDPKFDADGLNGGFPPPTVEAVIEILNVYQIDLKHLSVVIVGNGDLVGKPLSKRLQGQAGRIQIVDQNNASDLKVLGPMADVIISAAGSPKLITADLIKAGAVVIDCGTSESSGSIVGDVDTDSVISKARLLSAVPGGVGPVTVAELLKNVVSAAKLK